MVLRTGVAWLSSSSAEIARAREVLKAMKPSGVLDELGFLVLFSAFGNRFYPATNTVMTRARYLVFVPAVYKYLEEEVRKVSGKDVDRIARDLQYELSKVLLDNGERAIGRFAKRDIVRPPSNIYWNALAELGIATQAISESSYQERLSQGAIGPRVLRDDDNAAHPDDNESLWDPTFRVSRVLSDGVFQSSTRFRLWKNEAVQLKARYDNIRPDNHDSMLTHLVRLGERHGLESLDAIERVWDAPNVPAELSNLVDHARRLSLFGRGVTLQYHRMLIEKRQEKDPGARDAFVAWFDVARDELKGWNLEEFFTLIRRFGAERRALHDREFFGGWTQRCVAASSAVQALDDPISRGIVTRREADARPGKRRLLGGRNLQSFGVPKSYPLDDYYLMNYRHGIGRQFARDIVEGLQGDEA